MTDTPEQEQKIRDIARRHGIFIRGTSAMLREAYQAGREQGRREENERLAKYAAAEAKYWEEADSGDISLGGIAAASNICSEILAPGKAIGRKYDPVTNTLTDDLDSGARLSSAPTKTEK